MYSARSSDWIVCSRDLFDVFLFTGLVSLLWECLARAAVAVPTLSSACADYFSPCPLIAYETDKWAGHCRSYSMLNVPLENVLSKLSLRTSAQHVWQPNLSHMIKLTLQMLCTFCDALNKLLMCPVFKIHTDEWIYEYYSKTQFPAWNFVSRLILWLAAPFLIIFRYFAYWTLNNFICFYSAQTFRIEYNN